jgi:hypothetical protein
MFKKKLTKRKKIIWIIIGSLVVALIVFRIMLPGILLRYVNKQLTKIDGYKGHVDDIDVSLFRGAYTIDGIRLDKINGKIPVPFFQANKIDLSIEWGAIFHGSIVAEIVVEEPVLNFVKGPTEATSQTSVDKDWTEVVDKLIPFKLNRLEINKGQIHYRDFHSSPEIDIFTTNIHILAKNLSNAKHAKDTMPSTAVATADVYDGKASLNMKLDPLNKEPTFDLNAKMTTLNLVNLNNFLKAYGNFDVEKGTISLYTEAAAKDNLISGYTKPIIKDMKVSNWKEDKGNIGKIIWESIIEGVSWLLTNHKKDQLATKAEFEGRLDDPNVNTWVIIGQLLRNAFIQALYPSLENSVNINTIDKKEENKTFLQQIFGKSKKNNKKDKDNK